MQLTSSLCLYFLHVCSMALIIVFCRIVIIEIDIRAQCDYGDIRMQNAL